MKTYFIKSLVVGFILFFSIPAKSEVTLNLNFGLPAWGPAGYENERYYYLPDVQSYYDTRWGMFVYYDDGRWIHRSQLPAIYINYNLFNGYKVVMAGHRGHMPYGQFKSYKVKYAKGYNPGRQNPIGNHPKKGNPHYKNQGKKNQDKSIKNNHGNGNSNGHSFKMNKNQNSNGASGKSKNEVGSKGNGQKATPSHKGSNGNNGGGKGKK